MGKTPVNYGEPGSATSAAPRPGTTTVTAAPAAVAPGRLRPSASAAPPPALLPGAASPPSPPRV